jgi:hypothetical protein
MADRKDRFKLIREFVSLYQQRYGKVAIINRNTEQWNAEGIIDTFGMDGSIELLHYYFSYAQSPNWTTFARTYDKIYLAKQAMETDLRERAERREKAKEWLAK